LVPSPDVPCLLGEGEALARLVAPLGLDLRDATSGLVHVASIVDGGSAEASGVFEVGDVVSFCSVPFGDGLCTVCRIATVLMLSPRSWSRATRRTGISSAGVHARGGGAEAAPAR
jgi:hypothetical protein